MTEEPTGSGWPDDPADEELEFAGPGTYTLMILYPLPFLILLLFPTLAWLVLLPFASPCVGTPVHLTGVALS